MHLIILLSIVVSALRFRNLLFVATEAFKMHFQYFGILGLLEVESNKAAEMPCYNGKLSRYCIENSRINSLDVIDGQLFFYR